MNQSDEPLEGEDETDVLLRQYGLGRDEEDVIERYENALAAFDDEEKQVRRGWQLTSFDSNLCSFHIIFITSYSPTLSFMPTNL